MTCFFLPSRLIKMEWSLHAEWPYTSNFSLPCCCCVFLSMCRRFHISAGFRKSRKWGWQGCLRLSSPGYKETPREPDWAKEAKRKKETERTAGQGVGGGGVGQWGLWWGLSGEHMWVTVWINTLSLLSVVDLQSKIFIVYALKFPFSTQSLAQHLRNIWMH